MYIWKNHKNKSHKEFRPIAKFPAENLGKNHRISGKFRNSELRVNRESCCNPSCFSELLTSDSSYFFLCPSEHLKKKPCSNNLIFEIFSDSSILLWSKILWLKQPTSVSVCHKSFLFTQRRDLLFVCLLLLMPMKPALDRLTYYNYYIKI
jgi:hypothetical protein